MNGFRQLLCKDFQLELRSKETVVLLFGNIVALSAIVSSGVASAFVEPPVVLKLYPTLLWSVFFFTAALSSSRVYEPEVELRAFERIALSGAADWVVYLSKLISSGAVLFLGFLLTVVVLGVLTDVSCWPHMLDLSALGILVILGYNALSTLLVAISSSSRLKGMLLPLLLLPLVFPLFFAGMELTFSILGEGGLSLSSPWLSLLLGADVVYLALGVNLYRFVLEE